MSAGGDERGEVASKELLTLRNGLGVQTIVSPSGGKEVASSRFKGVFWAGNTIMESASSEISSLVSGGLVMTSMVLARDNRRLLGGRLSSLSSVSLWFDDEKSCCRD